VVTVWGAIDGFRGAAPHTPFTACIGGNLNNRPKNSRIKRKNMAETKYGTFEDLMKITEEHLQPIAIRLREIILNLDPEACEVVRLGDRASTFGVGPKKMSEGYAYILPHKKWVNLGFYKGAPLMDKSKLLEGTGKELRHIKIHTFEDANRPEIKELLKLALNERKMALKKIVKTMYNPIHWLEIATTDLDRAKKFYETVFKLEFQYVEMPDSKMYMFGEQEKIGSGGCLVYSGTHKPSMEGSLVYFSSEDLANELDRVEHAGGKIILSKTDIGEFGYFAHIIDTEGNKIGLHSMK
jgi:predicted enzyme related to lactoylglutathione lyase